MQRYQMSVKPSYNMTPNQRKMLAERRSADAEVVKKSGKKPLTFIFGGVGIVVIAAIAGIVVVMNNNQQPTDKIRSVFADEPKKPETENTSSTTFGKISNESAQKPEKKIKSETPVQPIENKEIESTPRTISIEPIEPNTKFAENFLNKVVLIENNMNETIKRDMLNVWAGDVIDFSVKWREFSNKAKKNARWGISRKAAEIADDWEYLAELFSKDVSQEDREHLRDIVTDIINREATLKQQCKN